MTVMGVIVVATFIVDVTVALMIVRMLVIAMTVMVVVMIAMIGCGVRLRIVGMSRMPTARIGASFWIERRFDLDHARAETAHHFFDDVIAANAKSSADDLRGKVAVAEMPRNADEVQRVCTANLDQRLRCRYHLDQPPVIQHKRIAAAQRDGLFEIEQKF